VVEEMIKLIGTNHLMSKEEIINLIEVENPEVIGVELCQTRFDLMVLPLIENREIETKQEKDTTLIGKISNVIKEKAEKENITYGSDMFNSCIYAKENNLPLEFVDLDIMKVKELMEKIPQEEQQGFMNELVAFQNLSLKESAENINEEEVLNKLKLKYPIAYEFLITVRELVIVKNILKLERKYPNKKILVVLGKGHIKSIEEELKEW